MKNKSHIVFCLVPLPNTQFPAAYLPLATTWGWCKFACFPQLLACGQASGQYSPVCPAEGLNTPIMEIWPQWLSVAHQPAEVFSAPSPMAHLMAHFSYCTSALSLLVMLFLQRYCTCNELLLNYFYNSSVISVNSPSIVRDCLTYQANEQFQIRMVPAPLHLISSLPTSHNDAQSPVPVGQLYVLSRWVCKKAPC